MADINLVTEYGDNGTIIQLYPGDEKRLHFPRHKNWRYQIAIEALYRNKRTGKSFHYGRSAGSKVTGNYCCSIALTTFDYETQLAQAIEHGFQRCAGGVEDHARGDSSGFVESQWRNWYLVNDEPIAVYLILWRNLKMTERLQRKIERLRTTGELPEGQRYVAPPIEFRKKVVKPKPKKTMEYKGATYELVSHRVDGRIAYRFWRKLPEKKRKVRKTK